MERADYRLLPLCAVGVAKGISEVYVKPFVQDHKPKWEQKEWALAGLVGGVICYDLLVAKEGQTISEGVDSLLERGGVSRAMTLGAIAITAGHLANIIPQKYDPIHRLTNVR